MDIVICAKAEVDDWLEEECFEAVVSIGDRDDPPPDCLDDDDDRVLRLVFADVEDESLDGPCLEDVYRLIALGDDLIEGGGRVLIHCAAGVSRSSACAVTLLALAGGPGEEAAAVEALGALPGGERADPNRRIVELADEALGREGRLVLAVDAAFQRRGEWW